jgi:RNA polymerase sigma-70 factor, ECF subfamily
MRRITTPDFERLYNEHAQALFAFLAYRTGNVALAEDLVADTFERVLVARKPFDPRKSSEKTWIYAIALNRLRDLSRRRAAEDRAVEQIGTASENGASNGQNGFEVAETRQLVMAALDHVSAEERETLALRYGADLSLSEIAKVIGKPRSTVEGRLYKGLKRLRAELEEPTVSGTDRVSV